MSSRYETFRQRVECEHCGTRQTAEVSGDRLANVAGFRCSECGKTSEALPVFDEGDA